MSNAKIQNLASIAGNNTATPEAPSESIIAARTEYLQQTSPAPVIQVADQQTAPATSPKLIAMQEELLAMELEDKRLELRLKKLNLEDTQDRIDDRELKRENTRQKSKTNGATLKQIADTEAAVQRRCNHRKGGNGIESLLLGRGTSSDYAIIDHTFCNGDRWITCLRCHKTWKPPVESKYATKEAYLDAYTEYKTALNFQTPNQPSTSVQFRFSDNGVSYRENTASVTLR